MLVWLRRRVVCENSGERHLEGHPEIEGYHLKVGRVA